MSLNTQANTAHITKVRDGYEVTISPTCRAVDGKSLGIIANKRLARYVAQQHGATPWNF